MNTARILRLKSLVFFNLMILAGCVGGGGLYSVSQYLPFGTWNFLLVPPSRAVKLLVYNYPNLFLEAIDGETYACDTNTTACAETEVIPEAFPVGYCGGPNPWTPIKPGKVVDALARRDCGPDGYVDIHFVALEDGAIWEWWQGRSALEGIFLLPACGALGALVGASVGIIILRSKRNQQAWDALQT